MLDFGWKRKAEKLKTIVLAGAHQLARELSPGISRILSIYERVAKTGDGSTIMEDLKIALAGTENEPKPIWEPIEVHGWKIMATMYLREGDLWWLVYAHHKNENPPSENDIRFLEKVIRLLGGEPTRHLIIGPRSSPHDNDRLPFGWWTWKNREQLLEIQVNATTKEMRIVPYGSRESDGYIKLHQDRTT